MSNGKVLTAFIEQQHLWGDALLLPEDESDLKAPFPYFGGKAMVAAVVWQRLGTVQNYVEPFAGSAAIALAAPYIPAIETWNDVNGYISNFWRATQADSDSVAAYADWPVNEADLHARHLWLVGRYDDLLARLMGDPGYYDAKIAGWWLWGICAWIGGGWCSGAGPWVARNGVLVRREDTAGQGIKRQRPHLGNAGQGINRQLPSPSDAGQCASHSAHLRETMGALRDRLRRVRVCCGDWRRVCGPTPTTHNGLTGMFLDPPYAHAGRADVYNDDHPDVFADVVRYALAHGDDPLLRIAVCGYYQDGLFPSSWEVYRWSAQGGYGHQGNGNGKANRKREAIWFSPRCREVY